MSVCGIIIDIVIYYIFFMRTIAVVLAGIVSFIYLINPTAGVLELIPDNLPILGNLDEAAAMTLLIAVFGYFGFDVSNLFKRKDKEKKEKIKESEFEDVK